MKRKFLINVILLMTLVSQMNGQDSAPPNPVLTADSLASGNYKDVLSSFFQLAFDRFTGTEKELRFTSTPFAVMARLDTNLLVDREYLRLKTLRNINFAFSAKLDSSYRFNGFASSVKYALINMRDETVSRHFLQMVQNNEKVKQLHAINNAIVLHITTLAPPDNVNAMVEYTAFRKGEITFSQLSQSLKNVILAEANIADPSHDLVNSIQVNSSFNLQETAAQIYQDMKTNFNNNLLWTISVSDTTYTDQFLFSNIVISSELLKGLNKFSETRNDVELNIKAALQLLDDSVQLKRDLKRTLFSFEPGVNVTFKTRSTQKSYLELKFSGAYYHNLGNLYEGEVRDRLMMNATVRVRVFKDIWIPFEVKYDPKNGNVFGFLNVRANFKALGNAASKLF